MKNDIKEALNNAVCYTHFVSLLFNNRPFWRVKKILGNTVLSPFLNTWQANKTNLINL